MKQYSSNLQKFLTGLVLSELKSQGMTQKQLAEKAFVSEKHLTRIFSGECAGSLGMWDHLLKTLGVKIWPDVSPHDA